MCRYNGSLPNGDRGRRKSRFALCKRPKANGVKPSTVHVACSPQAAKVKHTTRPFSSFTWWFMFECAFSVHETYKKHTELWRKYICFRYRTAFLCRLCRCMILFVWQHQIKHTQRSRFDLRCSTKGFCEILFAFCSVILKNQTHTRPISMTGKRTEFSKTSLS